MKPPHGRIGLGWRLQPREVERDTAFVEKCLNLWDLKLDTFDIAQNVFQPEYLVERAVRLGRERRRQMEEKNAEDEKWDRP